jgi:MFS family permease
VFNRLRETIHILTYREPVVHGPDAVIVPKRKDNAPQAGKVIAWLFEAFIFLYVVGFVAGHLGTMISRYPPTKAISVGTLIGALGAVLYWLAHNLTLQIQMLLKRRLNLADRLAPYFGHKLDETYRAMKG